MMRLQEDGWIVSEGLTPEWRWVHAKRAEQALAALKRIRTELDKRAPEGARARRYGAGLDLFLSSKSAARDRLLADPSLDYWLFLWDKHFALPCDEQNWHLQFGLFQGLAAALALEEGRTVSLDAVADPDGHVHLYGLPQRLELGPERALARVRLEVAGGKVKVFDERGPVKASLLRSLETVEGVRVETCGLLAVQGVVMHGLASPGERELARFSEVLRTAFAHVAERDPGLHAEMTDLVRMLVPLANPKIHGSVSSSYVNMRGTIALSHSEDPLLQAETLIHEFCHQKMNQLLLVDPILLPGQGGQVFYSPWRPDARRLRGLILGAHAFMNVARYLIRSLSREEYRLKAKIAVMCNVARRLYEVDQAVRSAVSYGRFTEFGSRFVMGMARETQNLFHAAQWFPPALMKEARVACEAHRKKHGLALTGYHRLAGFSPNVKPIPFGQKRVIRRRKPEEQAA